MPIETVENVKRTGFSTTHYFVRPNGDVFDELYNRYMQNPGMSKKEIAQFFKENPFDAEEMTVTINLYMEELAGDPTDEILEDVAVQIEELDHAPKGSYSVLIHDQWMDKRRADGMKESTKKRTTPDKIIKE